MKRLLLPAALLLLLFGASLMNARYLAAFTAALNEQLAGAEALAERGDWDRAREDTALAAARWQERGTYLHVTLHHADTDQISAAFGEVQEFLECEEAGEYSAANARLMALLALLSEAEQLTVQNIL